MKKQAAVRLHAAAGRCGLPAAAPATDREADALILSDGLVVKRVTSRGLQAIDQPDSRPGLAVGTPVAFSDGISKAKVNRVLTKPIGQLVHCRLQSEVALGRARRAVSGDRGLVRSRVPRRDLIRRQAVGAGQEEARQAADASWP